MNQVYNTLYYPLMANLTRFTCFARRKILHLAKNPENRFLETSVYVSRPSIANDIRNAVLRPNCGISLIYTPSGGGKTTEVLKALSDLQAENKIQGMLHSCWHCLHPSYREARDTLSRLKLEFQLSGLEQSTTLSNLLPSVSRHHPIVLYIENLGYPGISKSQESFLVGLAEDSVLTKRFNVVLSFNRLESYLLATKWNSGEKVRPINLRFEEYKWDRESIERLMIQIGLNKFCQHGNDGDSHHDPEYIRQLIDVFAIAGTPGFVIDYLQSPYKNLTTLSTEADKISLEWGSDRGILASHLQ